LIADRQRSTAHLIEPQTFFSLFRVKKADNQINLIKKGHKKTLLEGRA
jgi:hypothetical protein